MKWILLVLMVLHVQVTAGEIKLWFDDGTDERPGCGYPRFIFGEKDVRKINGSSVQNPVKKLEYVDFYTMMKAYVKMAGDRASVDIKFDEGMFANKALAVMREMSKIGLKSVVIPHEVEEEVIEKAKIDPKVKKTPASPSSTDTPFILPVPRSSEAFLRNEESEEGNVAPEAVEVKIDVLADGRCLVEGAKFNLDQVFALRRVMEKGNYQVELRIRAPRGISWKELKKIKDRVWPAKAIKLSIGDPENYRPEKLDLSKDGGEK